VPTQPPPQPQPSDKLDDAEDDDAGFAPVTLPGDGGASRSDGSDLLDQFYKLEKAAQADRLANVASAAAAIISKEEEAVEPIDRLSTEESTEESIDRSASTDKQQEQEQEQPKAEPTVRSTKEDADRSTVVRKGTRAKLPNEAPPPKLSPEALQKSVFAAMQEVDPTRDDRDRKSVSTSKRLIGDQADDDEDPSLNWWKGRLRALYFPVVRGSEGAGYLQVDIAPDGAIGGPDVRVVAFADRYDAAAACAVMEASSFMGEQVTYSVGALAAEKAEAEIREAFLRQAGGASAPRGILVFRPRKLPLKVGMSQSEFVQALVWQGAAQVALGRTGFKF
jgi:hypothetical protein